jgi:hypothetical protein
MLSRKDARTAVKVLLKANISTFEEVYLDQTLTFNSLSPVGMVYSDGTGLFGQTLDGGSERRHRILIDMMWEWGSGVEDKLDDLSQAVITLLQANQTSVSWSNLELDRDFSRQDYPEVNNVIYRRETLMVYVE